MCAYLPSFVITDPLLFSVYASSLLPLSCDNRQAVFVPISFSFFSPQQTVSDSYAHHPSRLRAIRNRHKRHKQPGIFFSSLQSFSLLSSLTSVSFFPPFSCLSFFLASTIGLALAGLPHHPHCIHHPCPHFIPLSVCLSFLLAVNFLSWFHSFQQSLLFCSSVCIHHLSGLFNIEETIASGDYF